MRHYRPFQSEELTLMQTKAAEALPGLGEATFICPLCHNSETKATVSRTYNGYALRELIYCNRCCKIYEYIKNNRRKSIMNDATEVKNEMANSENEKAQTDNEMNELAKKMLSEGAKVKYVVEVTGLDLGLVKALAMNIARKRKAELRRKGMLVNPEFEAAVREMEKSTKSTPEGKTAKKLKPIAFDGEMFGYRVDGETIRIAQKTNGHDHEMPMLIQIPKENFSAFLDELAELKEAI